MNKKDIFDVMLKSNIKIKKTDGMYSFFMDSKITEVKSQYQPILKALSSGVFSSEKLLASLVETGSNEVSANLTLAQFLMDCASYIE